MSRENAIKQETKMIAYGRQQSFDKIKSFDSNYSNKKEENNYTLKNVINITLIAHTTKQT